MLRVEDYTFLPRLRDFQNEVPGCRRLLQCLSCSAIITMPVDELILAYGRDAKIPDVLNTIECGACGASSMHATMVKSYLAAPKSRQGPTSWLHKVQGHGLAQLPKP